MKVLVHNVDDRVHVTCFTPEARKPEEEDGEFFKRMAPQIVPQGTEYDVVDFELINTRYPGKWCKASQSMKYDWKAAYAQKLDELKQIQSVLLDALKYQIEVAIDYEDKEGEQHLIERRKGVRRCLDNLDLSNILDVNQLAEFLPEALKG
jgi:hypothetical protein